MSPQPPPTLTSPLSTLLSFPTPQILLVTLNRPEVHNCISNAQHWDLHRIWEWFDREPALRCAILTGAGSAFCAGADLKEWNRSLTHDSSLKPAESGGKKRRGDRQMQQPPTGFGGLSRRHLSNSNSNSNANKKPIICAVNGPCFGGGFEMCINADIVLAHPLATFALPEVKVGVVAVAGGLVRLVRTVGRQRAMWLCLTGGRVSAGVMREWGVVCEVVGDDGGGAGGGRDGEGGGGGKGKGVVERAIEVAGMICANSPDGVVVSKYGVEMGWEGCGVEEGTEKVKEMWGRMEGGENMREGVRAFVEKRPPRWVDSKL